MKINNAIELEKETVNHPSHYNQGIEAIEMCLSV